MPRALGAGDVEALCEPCSVHFAHNHARVLASEMLFNDMKWRCGAEVVMERGASRRFDVSRVKDSVQPVRAAAPAVDVGLSGPVCSTCACAARRCRPQNAGQRFACVKVNRCAQLHAGIREWRGSGECSGRCWSRRTMMPTKRNQEPRCFASVAMSIREACARFSANEAARYAQHSAMHLYGVAHA